MYRKIVIALVLIATSSLAHTLLKPTPLIYNATATTSPATPLGTTEPFLKATSSTEVASIDQAPASDVSETFIVSPRPAIVDEVTAPPAEEAVTVAETSKSRTGIFSVPFYSQFDDISLPQWRKVGCGIASLAMLINFYEPGEVSVDTLLREGIAADAYLSDAGWTHAGLIGISKMHGLTGASISLASESMNDAFIKLTDVLGEGPVMASVHYTFEPTNPIPHLVVISGVKDGLVYYNDPAEPSGGGTISIAKFQSAWKKRYIEIRPV